MRTAVRSARDALDILKKQLALGSIAQTAVMAQETALAVAEAQLPPLRKQLALQRDLLAVLTGRSPGEPLPQTFALSALKIPQDLPLSLPSALIRQRPDVLAAEQQLHYATAQVGVAIADMLPQVNLTATLGGGVHQPVDPACQRQYILERRRHPQPNSICGRRTVASQAGRRCGAG